MTTICITKQNLKKIIFLIGVLLCSSCVLFSQTSKKRSAETKWNYDIECVGVGNHGTYLIRVWTYSATPQIINNQDKKNAVHGIIFRGFEDGEAGAIEKKPLAESKNVEQNHSEFFDNFFSDEGAYINYIAAVAEGNTTVIKVGKKFKIGVILSVSKDRLRDDLEKAGIIKSLDSGF